MILCAAKSDRDGVLKWSRDLGFLTGEETKEMNDAHIDATLAIGKPFTSDSLYNFSDTSITQRVHEVIPTMVSSVVLCVCVCVCVCVCFVFCVLCFVFCVLCMFCVLCVCVLTHF